MSQELKNNLFAVIKGLETYLEDSLAEIKFRERAERNIPLEEEISLRLLQINEIRKDLERTPVAE